MAPFVTVLGTSVVVGVVSVVMVMMVVAFSGIVKMIVLMYVSGLRE